MGSCGGDAYGHTGYVSGDGCVDSYGGSNGYGDGCGY